MKFRFTTEMFEKYNGTKMKDKSEMSLYAAKFANEILDEHLAALPKVYGYSSGIEKGEMQMFTESAPVDVTHSAILFDIEELPKKACEHEPKLFLKFPGAEPNNIAHTAGVGIICSKCGVRLKSKCKWEAE